MRLFRRKDSAPAASGVATVTVPPPGFEGTTDELWAEIERLTLENRARRDRETDRRLLRLRHLAGLRMVDATEGGAEYAAPDPGALPAPGDGLPEFRPADLTPGLLRAAFLRDGCLLVRGLVDRREAERLAGEIDRSFAEREHWLATGEERHDYYEEFQIDPSARQIGERDWIRMGGGVLAVDSPRLHFEMVELFHAARLPALVSGFLGERALISAHKTTLRKATPDVSGAWHQDGAFMGPVRSLNLWLSLSRCGDVAPGLDLVPKRLEDYVKPGTDEAILDFQVSQRMAEDAAGDTPIIRPIFEPGDALLFDEKFLHSTAVDPSMRNPRYAIENWFFASAPFPGDYAPVAV